MLKKIIVGLGFLLTLNSYSQEELTVFENTLKTTSSSIKDIIPIVNEQNGDISLFLMDATKVYGYLLNDEFKVVKSLSSEDKSRKYKMLIGKSISNINDYRIFLTNNNQNKFASINFSYGEKASTFEEFELASKKEMLVQTVTYINDFYLISIIKNTSKLCFYKFNDDGKFTRTELDFSANKFIDSYGKEMSLFHLLTIGSGLKRIIDLKKIDENSPNSIEVTSEKSKLYLRENLLVFTFDENKNFTQIISIDLKTFEKKVSQIEKPSLESDLAGNSEKTIYAPNYNVKTNSFLKGNNLFLITSTDKEFNFTIKNYNTKETIKEYNVNAEDSITFKNTPIIQEGGAFESYREMEKTRKFLRKITNGDIGVAVYKKGNQYQITLGGKKEIQRGGGGMMMMPMGGFGVPITSTGAVTVFFNPTYSAFNSYTSTKSTHIKGLFDLNFEHLKGDIEKNVFDKINEFEEIENTANYGETIFRYNGYYILGNYLTKDKKYIFRKFKD